MSIAPEDAKIPLLSVGGFQNFLFFSGQPVHRHAQDLGKDHQLVVRHEAVPGLYLADGLPLDEHALDLHPRSEVRLGDAFGRPHLVDAVAGDILLSLKIVNLHTQPLLGTLTVPRKRAIFVIKIYSLYRFGTKSGNISLHVRQLLQHTGGLQQIVDDLGRGLAGDGLLPSVVASTVSGEDALALAVVGSLLGPGGGVVPGVGAARELFGVHSFFILSGLCGLQSFVDFCGDLAVAAVKPVTRAGFRRKPAVDGHVLLVYLTYEVFISLPKQPGDAVALADVHQQVNEGLVGRVGDRPRVLGNGVRHLNGDGPVVIAGGGGTPRTVGLVHIQTDAPVAADAVVAAGLAFLVLEQFAAALHGQVPGHTVDGDGVDGVLALAGMVGGQLGVADQRAVTHCPHLLSERRG